jgi:hypothetical protein
MLERCPKEYLLSQRNQFKHPNHLNPMEMVTIPKEEYEELKRQAKNRPLLDDLKEAFESVEKEGLIWK